MLESIGTCEGEIDENLMDVFTALSGSGPAYVCNLSMLIIRTDLIISYFFFVVAEKDVSHFGCIGRRSSQNGNVKTISTTISCSNNVRLS